MAEYEFTLRYALPTENQDAQAYLPALEKAGCDDALIGVGRRGRIALEFVREARSAEAAMTSALKAVAKAIPRARLVQVEPDLVGLTELAEVFGCSRQNMRKTALSNPDFPVPVHEGEPELYHLAEVLDWAQENGRIHAKSSARELCAVAMQVNLAKELNKLPRRRVRLSISAAVA